MHFRERGILGVCFLERENERDRLEVSGLKRERERFMVRG